MTDRTKLVLKLDKDKCYYCENPAEYWDQVGATIISVCKKHMNNYYVS